MRQEIIESHYNDQNGNPAGGQTTGLGIDIVWQDGPLNERGPNGAFVEGVLQAAIGRLEYYQRGKFACQANQDALDCLDIVMCILAERTADRLARGVLGTHQQ